MQQDEEQRPLDAQVIASGCEAAHSRGQQRASGRHGAPQSVCERRDCLSAQQRRAGDQQRERSVAAEEDVLGDREPIVGHADKLTDLTQVATLFSRRSASSARFLSASKTRLASSRQERGGARDIFRRMPAFLPARHASLFLVVFTLPVAASLVVHGCPRPLQTAAGRASSVACVQESPTPEEVTKKWGFEAGLFSALRSKGDGKGMVKAGDLLKRYGGAYLLTSTSFAIVSFTICYLLVDNGVDVAALLSKVGIQASSTSETAGTVGFAAC